MWSYLGGDLNLAVTWLVIAVIVVVIYVENCHVLVTACVGWFSDKVSLFPTVPGGEGYAVSLL